VSSASPAWWPGPRAYDRGVRRSAILVLLTGLAISGVVGGCGSARTRYARIVGVVEVCGAPFPRANPAQARHCTPQRGSVSVLDATHRLAARMRLVGGRFAFKLVPGRYMLIAWNSGNGPWRRAVSAVTDRNTRVNIVIEAI
jgi:hypothetical protein